MIIRLTLPFPPSINALFGGGSAQKRFPSKQYKAWWKACPQLDARGLDNIEITYSYYFPDKRNRDTENYVKAISDYLVSSGVIVDDNWLVVKRMTLIPMGVDKLAPRVEISISTHTPPSPAP